jgi:hypothetical protein
VTDAQGKDAMKVVMPAGEIGPRNPTKLRPATASGGTSGAEDTTRAAGYVTDMTLPREAPPGPPVQVDPASLVGPEGTAPPPEPPKGDTAKPSKVAAAAKRLEEEVQRAEGEGMPPPPPK